jgi:two-component system chemotaxis response regulator CheB
LNLSVLNKIVVIGASTGGPGQIEKIINAMPPLTNTTVIIAQHMVVGFIPSFAKRLQEHSKNHIYMAENGTVIEAGSIYICSGLTSVIKKESGLYFSVESVQEHGFNPDINSVFCALVPFAKNIELFCIILTGIGNDGVEGCTQLSLNGARTATESEQSAIVDGMTSRARKEVPNIEVSEINEIVNKIKEFCS